VNLELLIGNESVRTSLGEALEPDMTSKLKYEESTAVEQYMYLTDTYIKSI
jgi:hypothetical protein